MLSRQIIVRLFLVGLVLCSANPVLATNQKSSEELLKEYESAFRSGQILNAIGRLYAIEELDSVDSTTKEKIASAFIQCAITLTANNDLQYPPILLSKVSDYALEKKTQVDLKDAWSSVVLKDPDNPKNRIGYGRALEETRDYRGAAEQFNFAEKLFTRENEKAHARRLADDLKRYEYHCVPTTLNDVFIYPRDDSKFNSALWKTDQTARFKMLFDLYRQPLRNKTQQEIDAILGPPDEKTKAEVVLYKLGLQNGMQTSLLLSFYKGGLQSIALRQNKLRAHFCFCTPWQTTNLTWTNLSEGVNKKLMLVGMPTCLISKVVRWPEGAPRIENNRVKIYKFGPYEFEYNSDNKTVKRFRIEYSQSQTENGWSDWEDKNLRGNLQYLSNELDYSMIIHGGHFDNPGDLLVENYSPFNKNTWMLQKSVYTSARLHQVSGLVRSYPIIGMTRTDLQQLIGEGYRLSRPLQSPLDPTPSSYETENYSLGSGFCGNSASHVFQVGYEGGRVSGYRLLYCPARGHSEEFLLSESFPVN
jgi:hypothetical protein